MGRSLPKSASSTPPKGGWHEVAESTMFRMGQDTRQSSGVRYTATQYSEASGLGRPVAGSHESVALGRAIKAAGVGRTRSSGTLAESEVTVGISGQGPGAIFSDDAPPREGSSACT